jgi:glutathione S-transferase
VHPAHAHVSRPERYAADAAVFPALKTRGLETFHGYLKQINNMLAGKDWFLDRYSVIDPYGQQRPAVRRVLEQERVPV